MAADWYFLSQGRIGGPVTFEHLQKLAQKGQIAPTTPVRQGPTAAWIQAKTVPNLTGAPTPSAPRPAPPAAAPRPTAPTPPQPKPPTAPARAAAPPRPPAPVATSPVKATPPRPASPPAPVAEKPRRARGGWLWFGLFAATCCLLMVAVAGVGFLVATGQLELGQIARQFDSSPDSVPVPPADSSPATTPSEATAPRDPVLPPEPDPVAPTPTSSLAVVSIRGPGFEANRGTGFLITPRLIVTASVVMEDLFQDEVALEIVRASGRKPLPATTVIVEDLDRNLTFLQLPADQPDIKAWATSEPPAGSTVTVYASRPDPAEGLLVGHAGQIETPATSASGRIILSLSAPPWTQGGPLLDPSLHLVGLFLFDERLPDDQAACIPVKTVLGMADEAARLAPDAISRRQVLHDARTACVLLDRLGVLYTVALDTYAQEMRAAVERGQTANDGLEFAISQIDARVNAVDAQLLPRLRGHVPELTASMELNAESKDGLTLLWAGVQAMRQIYDEPEATGDVEEFQLRINSLTRQVQDQTAVLRRRLGWPAPP